MVPLDSSFSSLTFVQEQSAIEAPSLPVIEVIAEQLLGNATNPSAVADTTDAIDASDYSCARPRRKKVAIASYSGGGVRGIIPARISAEVESQTGKPISELFDLFAGTSSGAIVALALNCPEKPGSQIPKYRAEELVKLYKDDAAHIFPQVSWLWKPIQFVSNCFVPKYSPLGLQTVLKKYCGDILLSDSIKNIAIPVAEMPEAYPWTFTNKGAFRGILLPQTDLLTHISAVEALEATTAAPTFFPYKELCIESKTHYFMDGGTYSNNPAPLAYSYAQSLYPLQRDWIFSCFGTGDPPIPDPASINSYYNNGTLHWGSNFPTISMLLAAREAFRELQTWCPDVYICQPKISEEIYTLDNSDPKILDELVDCANKFIEDNHEMMRQLCHNLSENCEAELT